MDEQTIRSTDHDALSCRISLVSKSYLQDPSLPSVLSGFQKFLKYDSKTPRRVMSELIKVKSPVINRGSYIRIRSIDIIIKRFIEQYKEAEEVRILNLGAGSDTRSFQILKGYQNVEVIEIDFPDSVKFKKATIVDDEILCDAIGANYELHSDLDKFYQQLDNSELRTDRFLLIPMDLREIDTLKTFLASLQDKPTLIISECMLCYLTTEESSSLLHTLHKNIPHGILAIYDPLGGEGSFGNVMIDNLKMRNLSMSTLLEFNSLSKYKARLQKIGFQSVKIDHMFNVLNTWLDQEEIRRISKLEFLDEIEELKLLLEHYCLSLSTWGMVAFLDDGLKLSA